MPKLPEWILDAREHEELPAPKPTFTVTVSTSTGQVLQVRHIKARTADAALYLAQKGIVYQVKHAV